MDSSRWRSVALMWPRFRQFARENYPGAGIAVLLAGVASGLISITGGSVVLVALLLGLVGHRFIPTSAAWSQGVDWTASTVLRFAVALLGFRISFADLGALGWEASIGIACVVLICLGTGLLLARLTGRQWQLGVLTGGAVGICGASAAIALAAVLPNLANRDRMTVLTVVGVTGLSTLAMVVYPWVFLGLGWSDSAIGFALGATIHDVAQVVGAGYAVSPEAGDVALIAKMQRVVLLPVVLGVIILAVTRSTQGTPIGLPWFVIAFAIAVVLNSVVPIPGPLLQGVHALAQACLVTAIAALGLKTSVGVLFRSGGYVMAILVVETLILVGVVTLAMAWLGHPVD